MSKGHQPSGAPKGPPPRGGGTGLALPPASTGGGQRPLTVGAYIGDAITRESVLALMARQPDHVITRTYRSALQGLCSSASMAFRPQEVIHYALDLCIAQLQLESIALEVTPARNPHR